MRNNCDGEAMYEAAIVGFTDNLGKRSFYFLEGLPGKLNELSEHIKEGEVLYRGRNVDRILGAYSLLKSRKLEESELISFLSNEGEESR